MGFIVKVRDASELFHERMLSLCRLAEVNQRMCALPVKNASGLAARRKLMLKARWERGERACKNSSAKSQLPLRFTMHSLESVLFRTLMQHSMHIYVSVRLTRPKQTIKRHTVQTYQNSYQFISSDTLKLHIFDH